MFTWKILLKLAILLSNLACRISSVKNASSINLTKKYSKIIKHLIYWSSEKCAQIFLSRSKKGKNYWGGGGYFFHSIVQCIFVRYLLVQWYTVPSHWSFYHRESGSSWSLVLEFFGLQGQQRTNNFFLKHGTIQNA